MIFLQKKDNHPPVQRILTTHFWGNHSKAWVWRRNATSCSFHENDGLKRERGVLPPHPRSRRSTICAEKSGCLNINFSDSLSHYSLRKWGNTAQIALNTLSPKRNERCPFQPKSSSGKFKLSLNGISSVNAKQLN